MKLLELENELAGSDGVAKMKQYDDVLLALDKRLADVLQEGLPPGEYAKAEQLKEAVIVARKLLRLEVRENGAQGK